MNRSDADLVDALLSGVPEGDPEGPCLDANVLGGLAEGTLREAERDRALAHLATCAACRTLVAAIADAGSARAVETPFASRREPRLWLAAAAVLLVGVGLALFLSRLPPSVVSAPTETLVARALEDLSPHARSPLAPIRAASAAEMASFRPGGAVLRGGFELWRPAGTTLSPRPSLAWTEVPGATRYEVVLVTEDGALWERETEEARLAYPDDEPPLARGGRYVLEVTARGASTDTARRSFAVAGEAAVLAWTAFEKEARDRLEEPLVWLALAHAALGQDLGGEALACAERFAAARPADPYGRQTLEHVRARFHTR